jgi:hypothetical protein
MKRATVLKVSPLSLRKMQELTPACMIKKTMRKRPVRAIVNFLPIEEEKSCFQVIVQWLYYDFGAAKIRCGRHIILNSKF